MKKILNAGLFTALFLFTGSSFAKQDYWQVDVVHSTVGFSVTHLGLSKVHGWFDDYSAKIKADDQTGKLTWVKATAQIASLRTGVNQRDEHLQTADFFDAAKYPTITIETQSIQWNGDTFKGKAKVTIKGKTKVVAFTGDQTGVVHTEMNGKKSLRAGYEVSAVINRQDFGLTFNAVAEGVNVVSDEVKLRFEVQTFRLLE